jgi:transposase
VRRAAKRKTLYDMWRATYPFSGHLFLFRSKRADYLKVLYYDGTGLCLFANYLSSYYTSFGLL